METAPRDGTVIDLWSAQCGWINDVWFDKDDGWVTIYEGTLNGWRPRPKSRDRDA